jgi:hypothetical protein
MVELLQQPVRGFGDLLAMLKERRIGFLMREVMDGDHEFEPGMGPSGRLPMEYRITWGSKHFFDFLDPTNERCLISEVEGTVSVGGLCEAAKCRGTLDLKYFSAHCLRYSFDFEVAGKDYRYVGDKVNIWPWNFPTTHTTCVGTLVEIDTGKLVSRSVTYFRFWRAPGFVTSFRLA